MLVLCALNLSAQVGGRKCLRWHEGSGEMLENGSRNGTERSVVLGNHHLLEAAAILGNEDKLGKREDTDYLSINPNPGRSFSFRHVKLTEKLMTWAKR